MLRHGVMVLFFWSLVMHQVAQAQLPFATSQVIPSLGDTLFYQNDELPRRITITPPGPSQLWNFATLLGPYLEFQTIHAVVGSKDVMQFSSDKGFRHFYTTEAKTLIWKGSNRIQLGKTMIDENWTSAEGGLPQPSLDMDYQDDHDFSAIFQCTMAASRTPVSWKGNLPSGMDSIRISVLIDRNMTVDASGTIFLGSGFRQDVYRFRVQDIINKKIWAKKGSGGWQDITSLVRLEDLLSEKITSYHFVSLESGGNLCSVFLDQNGTPNRVSFIIPKEQARFYKTAVSSQYVYAYPNPALSYVRFKFIDIPPGSYTLKFYDVFMRSLFEKQYDLAGGETVEINISHLQKGPYLYSLVDQTGKKMVTKRLIVIKP